MNDNELANLLQPDRYNDFPPYDDKTNEQCMDITSQLWAIEEIKQLKARYFLYVDSKDWTAWENQVWASDAQLYVPSFREAPFINARNIARWSETMMAGCVSIHHGYTPIIEILSSTEAKGVWAMEDLIFRDAAFVSEGKPAFIHGWGHYHEMYIKSAEGWRIATSRLTRLKVEVHAKVPSPPLPKTDLVHVRAEDSITEG